MPKRSKKESETIDDLVEEVSRAQLITEDAISNLNVPSKPESKMDNIAAGEGGITAKRNELIQASTDGHITQKVEYLKKASNRVIEKVHKQLEAQREKEANIFLTDLAISHFEAVLGGLDAVESPKSLTEELKTNVILKRDIESIISTVSPYIPLIGLLGGVAITGKHIYRHQSKELSCTPDVNLQNRPPHQDTSPRERYSDP